MGNGQMADGDIVRCGGTLDFRAFASLKVSDCNALWGVDSANGRRLALSPPCQTWSQYG